jgi:hypothetical protein
MAEMVYNKEHMYDLVYNDRDGLDDRWMKKIWLRWHGLKKRGLRWF